MNGFVTPKKKAHRSCLMVCVHVQAWFATKGNRFLSHYFEDFPFLFSKELLKYTHKHTVVTFHLILRFHSCMKDTFYKTNSTYRRIFSYKWISFGNNKGKGKITPWSSNSFWLMSDSDCCILFNSLSFSILSFFGFSLWISLLYRTLARLWLLHNHKFINTYT